MGLVDSSGLRKWELRGPDALRAADHMVTQDCSVRSSLFDRVLALALIDGGVAGRPGARVQVDGVEAEVAALPFHDPERARPRA